MYAEDNLVLVYWKLNALLFHLLLFSSSEFRVYSAYLKLTQYTYLIKNKKNYELSIFFSYTFKLFLSLQIFSINYLEFFSKIHHVLLLASSLF